MATKATVLRNSQEFTVPYDERMAQLVHGAHPMLRGQLLALPHKEDVVKIARNMGYLVPAPISAHYDWNGDTPFDTQKITAALLTMQKRAYVLSEMGTGKTRATLHAINWLIKMGEIESVLVVAPLSTLSPVWDREIFEFFNHLTVGILHGSREEREGILERPHDIYVINHDGVKVIEKQLIAKQEIDCVVIDELAVFRNKSADRWKALNRVIEGRKYVWGLTGSPTPREPTDAFAQVKLLTPNNVPNYMKAFQRQTMRQVSQFRWVALSDANETVHKAMQPAVRYKRNDCIELPPISYQARRVDMSKKQDDTYKGLMTQLMVAFKEGKVTAANEGVLFSKLLQVACGWIYTSDKRIVELDPKPRLEQLYEELDESLGKVIVFVEFIHAAEALYACVQNKKYSCELVTGSVSKKSRDRIFGEFENKPDPRVIVAHPKCMSHGLNLTAANTIVWYTPSTSLETYEQANARISRPGQKQKQLIIHLTGTPIETKIYRRLQAKRTLQGALLEMFEEEV